MRILICGIGSIGARHLANLQHLGLTDIILYRTGRATLTNDLNGMHSYPTFNNLDDALREKPDIAVISNPTSLHIPTAIKCGEAGCDLLIEKPISHTLDGVGDLLALIEERALVAMVAYQFRFNVQIEHLKYCLADQNEYGKAVYAAAEWSEYLPDWHPWEDYTSSYASRRDLGGGVVLTQVHPLNYLIYLLGMHSRLSVAKINSGTLEIDVDDVADLTLWFDEGLLGHVHVDYLKKPRSHSLEVRTTKGTFTWDCHDSSLLFVRHSGAIKVLMNNPVDRNDAFLKMMHHFLYCCAERSKTRCDFADVVTEFEMLQRAIYYEK